MDFNIYSDIERRTNGEIYIGVVGPVRTGKSTFIKNFMDLVVVPKINDKNEAMRAKDELPQSSSGRTIMTTEPKFIPNKAVDIAIAKGVNAKVRLIDCVGYMVEGAVGHLEENAKTAEGQKEEVSKERMVKTPWFDHDIPFSKAAEIGTRKVISEHSTIGIVITTDGSFTDIDAGNYDNALDKTVQELKAINKPFVILVNSMMPNSSECMNIRKQIEEKYNVTTMAVNCLQLNENDVSNILEKILFEFPVVEIEMITPKWLDIMDEDNPLKKYLIDFSRGVLDSLVKVKDINVLPVVSDNEFIKSMQLNLIDLSSGKVKLTYDIDEKYYYETLSELTGTEISNQLQLIRMVKELSKEKNNYIKVNNAIEKVKSSGYGIVTPDKNEIMLDEPELIRSGSKFGVKIRALAPSIHFIKANVLTEIAPIIGSEEQANDLIEFIKKNSEDETTDVWSTNIFGKTIEQIVLEGMTSKINNLTEETQGRMQNTIEKITNDQSRGVICILL